MAKVLSLRSYARRRGVSAEAVSKAIAAGRLRDSVVVVNGQPKIRDHGLADREWDANTRPRADHPRAMGDPGQARLPGERVGQVVYFIRCAAGPIKIGVAVNLAKRLEALQCASPFRLDVVACVAGGYDLEAKIHLRLEEHRIRGEWFADTPEVREAIAALVAEAIRL